MTSAPRTDSDFEVVVVGGGHAGCEAALAAARLGHHTALVTQNPDTVAAMACNCSIGGPGKAHLVREIDALGGEMGRNIDRTFTHIRLLNASRGPAVQALRAQADKALYRTSMKRVLESQDRLWLIQDTVTGIDAKGDGVRSVALLSGRMLPCAAVVVCSGTFLNGMIHMGEVSVPAGRAGEAPATHLSDCLAALGLPLRRFKTGTVPRVLFSSIDLRRVRVQPSEPGDQRFARLPVPRPPDSLLPCHVTSTNARTHALLRANSRLSALWSGRIEGTGPRYCPSMEAKLQRFPERDAHIVFLEREGWQTEEVYVQGISSAMPADVQLAMLHTIKGLERAHMTRPGYAIEYDSVDASCLEPSLALSALPGLFFAGQVNGTSGYEEAAAQGLIAGINAARYLQGQNSLVLSRQDGYIGVMVRDLTAVHLDEPYRMLTSRAEFRLIFGQDLAWERLAPTAEAIGLVTREAAGQPSKAAGAQPTRSGLIRGKAASVGSADQRAAEAYFRRDRSRLRSIERMSDLLIPHGLRYADLPLRLEARERLAAAKPVNLGQAAAVPGITPADMATLHAACAAFGKRAGECFT